ncbi:hypothetical protein Tco_0837651 [Tanacetum coccineum]
MSDQNVVSACVISLGMFKLDIEPLSSKLKNHREAHEDYLKKTKKHTDTLRGIVEQARRVHPSDPYLEYACKFTIRVHELLVYVSETCPSSKVERTKLVAVTPMNRNRKSLKEEMHEMRYQSRNSHDSYSHQSHHDPNDSEKLLTELNNDVKNDLEDFNRCIRSMRTIHDKLFDIDDQSKTDLEKSIIKFLDGQRVLNMFVKNNVNDIIIKMKQNEKNFQTKIKNMERKLDEWSKSKNVSSKQTDRTGPPPPQPQTEQVNAVFIRNGKSLSKI